MLIFWSESRDDSVEKSKGSVWRRKQQFDFLSSPELSSLFYNVAIRPKF